MTSARQQGKTQQMAAQLEQRRGLGRVLCQLRWCPFMPQSDATGCWGECPRCGRRSGFVARAELRAYLERSRS